MYRFFLFTAFFLSGCSSLIYQIIWTRKLAVIFGSSAFAISTILAVFFAGLALGSFLCARFIDKRLRHQSDSTTLRWYAAVEFLIGIVSLATLAVIPSLSRLPIPADTTLSTLFLIALATTACLIIPTTLMGMTFPLMTELAQRYRDQRVVSSLAGMYGINSLGAALGSILSGSVLIYRLGLFSSAVVATTVNLLITGLILLIKKTSDSRLPLKQTSRPHTNYSDRHNNIKKVYYHINHFSLALSFFLSGMAAIGLEIAFTRGLILTFGSSTYAFSTIVAIYIVGLALGSLAAQRYERNLGTTGYIFSWIILAAYICIVTPLLGKLPLYFLAFVQSNSSTIEIYALLIGACSLFILPATVLMGALFPWGISLATGQDASSFAASSGRLYGINTLGGIVGSLATGFLLIPLIGLEHTVKIEACFYLLIALVLLFSLPSRKTRVGALLLIGSIGSILFFLPPWNRSIATMGSFVYFPQLKQQTPDQLRSQLAGRSMLFYQDGLHGNVAVFSEGNDRFLRINGKADASLNGDLETVTLIGDLPLLLHPQAKEALVIGYGAGVSLGAMEQHDLDRIDVAEIEPAVIAAAPLFRQGNHDALSDPRVHLSITDGRNLLAKTNRKYDVIASEPSNPWISGIANLFTVESFTQAKDHLREDGLMLQWVQLYNLSPDDLKTILKTFSSVFPSVLAWKPSFNNDLLLVGSRHPPQVNLASLEASFARPGVRTDLGAIGINTPEQLFHEYLMGTDAIKRTAASGQLHTDNHPILEFSAPLSLWNNTLTDNLRLLFSQRDKTLDQILTAPLPTEKSQLLVRDAILSAYIVQDSDLNETITLIEEALKLAPDNQQTHRFLATLYLEKSRELFEKDRYAEAQSYLEKTTEHDPNNLLAQSNLGALEVQLGQLEEGKKHLDRATGLAPRRVEPHINLALYYKKVNQNRLANEELNTALTIDPQNTQALSLRQQWH